MQYLKALVIGMGILIVLGMALLVYGFVAKSKSKVENTETTTTEVIGKGFGEVSLDLPNQCLKEGMTAQGRRLIIELGPKTIPECAKIIILDMATGKALGTVSLFK